MFQTTDKKRLYWLIDQYLSNKMSAWDFGSEIHECYDIGLDLDTLTKTENEIFSELSLVASRFSPYENDHKKFPNAFYTESELKQKVLDAKEILKDH